MITSRNLIQLYAYLYPRQQRHVGEWKAEVFQDVPPLYYRVKMMDALLRAFGLRTGSDGFDDLTHGNFIERTDPDFFEPVKSRVMEFNKLHRPEHITPIGMPDVRSTYANLMRFYIKGTEWLSEQQSLSLDIATLFRYSMKKNLLDQITKHNVVLEDFLMLYFKDQQFDRKELIESFGYPDVDIDMEDYDWMKGII